MTTKTLIDRQNVSFELNSHVSLNQYLREMEDKVKEGDYTNLARNQLMHENIEKIYVDFLKNKMVLPNHYSYLKHFRASFAERLDLEEKQVVMSPGSDILISAILSRLTSNYKRIILFYPNYCSYEIYASYNVLSVHKLNYLFLSEADIFSSLQDRCREEPGNLLVLTNPDGFLGREFSINFLEEVLDLALEHNIIVVLDQAYSSFGEVNSKELLDKYTNLIIVNSFSKSFGVAGFRFATCFSSPQITQVIRKSGVELATSTHSLEYFNFLYSEKKEEIKKIIEDIKEQRTQFFNFIKTECPNWIAIRSQSNFVAVNVGSSDRAKALTDFLKTKGFLVRYLGKLAENLTTYVRVTAASQPIMDQLKKQIFSFYRENYD